ncbi:hypothetical protein QBC39DRAFT_23504 [Podospora conica]|nr:hypothetical protein QBC39DRAFT_23504 [Schizothecium conicum]
MDSFEETRGVPPLWRPPQLCFVVVVKNGDVVLTGWRPAAKACRAPKSLFGLGIAWYPWHMFLVYRFSTSLCCVGCSLKSGEDSNSYFGGIPRVEGEIIGLALLPGLGCALWMSALALSSRPRTPPAQGFDLITQGSDDPGPICISSWAGVTAPEGWMVRSKRVSLKWRTVLSLKLARGRVEWVWQARMTRSSQGRYRSLYFQNATALAWLQLWAQSLYVRRGCSADRTGIGRRCR